MNVQGIQQDEKWLICADPDSYQVYTLNIDTNELRIEHDTHPAYIEKAHKAIKLIEDLLKLQTGNWLTVGKNIDQYRRRKIPSYLLHKQSSQIATYLCQSTLSLAFSNVSSIKLHVKVNQYKSLFTKMSDRTLSLQNPYIIEIEARLVTGADEVIKNVLREVYQRFDVMLIPLSPKNQFILQIAGLKEFLTGNHPMLSYDRVRVSLRGMKHLEVILTEVPKQSDLSQMFPPIINRKKGSIIPIDWDIYLQVPVLLWYAPYSLPPFYEHYFQTRKFTRLSQYKNVRESKGHYFNNPQDYQYKIRPEPQENKQSLNSSGGKIRDIVSLKNELVNSNVLQQKQEILYSGECDWPFSVRICRIENLIQVLESDMNTIENPKDRATYNGVSPPLYITKQREDKSGDHVQGSREDPSNSREALNRPQVFLKLTKRSAWESIDDGQKSNYQRIAFGGQDDSKDVAAMQKKYGLDIIPYLISIQVSIFYGCQLLTSQATAETTKVPFSVNPCFYERITFSGIKVSMLPYQARLCFDIIAHSCQGEKQILGSTQVQIFDEERNFRSAMNSLNIWPFYKIDPRLLCMGQYWGINNSKEQYRPSQIEMKQYVNSMYGRLIVQLDSFIEPMKWSLRDEMQMEELGFSKIVKGKGYYERNQTALWFQSQQFEVNGQDLQNQQTGTGNSLSQINSKPKGGGSLDAFGRFGIQNLYGSIKNLSFSLLNNGDSKSRRFSQIIGVNNTTQNKQNVNKQQISGNIKAGAYNVYTNVLGQQNEGNQRAEGREDKNNSNQQFIFLDSFGNLNNQHIQQSQSIVSLNVNSYRTSFTQQQQQGSYTNYNNQVNQLNQGRIKDVNGTVNQHTYKNWTTTPRTEDLAILQTLLKVNPLNRQFYTENHKFILMICRNHYKTLTYAFQIFLMAIQWDDPEEVREVHNMIKLWTPLPPEDALPLLDSTFADETVRLYAVERLSILTDDELALYMLELTQGLLFEKHLFNPLAEMLLERSLQNPWVVGHELFWLLRSQLHLKPSYERYSLLLEQMLMLCGEFRDELMKEVLLNDELNRIAINVKEFNKHNKDQESNNVQLQGWVSDLVTKMPVLFNAALDNIDPLAQIKFPFALDFRMEGKEFIVQDCKVMNSKKLPLWLVVKSNCETYDEDKIEKQEKQGEVAEAMLKKSQQLIEKQIPFEVVQNNEELDVLGIINREDIIPRNYIQIIFKNGDDMRQDMLTLQLIKIMDKIWLDAGLDFRMKPYKVIATQDQVGMIEVVSSSKTTEKIHAESGVMGAFQTKSIWNYLKKKNTEPQSFEIATDNFLRSCAGYCVATFILGIGDRHSGNIMLTDTGHLFHIDFGHFLGNFKKKFGINRERAKFVFTEEMAFVMGGREGDLFKKFQSDCTNAYNMVRKHGHFLINIFLMNLSAGMPELQHARDVKYLEDMLALNISDQEAIARFKQEILTSLNDTWRSIDNFFHNIKRR